jgi:hypothetical protein
MRVIVSYHARDTYDIPDEKWHEAMALCADDEDDAFDLLMEESADFFDSSDVTDRYVEIERE